MEATNKKDRDEWEALYKEQFPDMKPEDVAEEVAMKALGRRLATPLFVKRYANRSTLRALIDHGRAFLKALREGKAAMLELAETEKLIDMMNRALQGANVQVRGENAGKQHNVDNAPKAKAFSEIAVSTALWEAMDHGDAGHDNLILMSQMPRYITEKFGISGNLYLYRNHAYENMVSKEQAILDGRPTTRGRKDIHFHDIGVDTITEAIMSIDEPILTARVKSKDGNPTVVMALPVLGKNDAPLCAVLSFYSDQVINGSHEKKPHIVLTITPRDFFDITPGRQGWKEFIENAINDQRILDYDKAKGSALTVTGQQTRLDSITVASLNDNIAQFKKFVNDFKEKNKINYNLTEAAAEQAARDAAEVEQFRNAEDAENARVRQAEFFCILRRSY